MCIRVYDRSQVSATTIQSQAEGEGLFQFSLILIQRAALAAPSDAQLPIIASTLICSAVATGDTLAEQAAQDCVLLSLLIGAFDSYRGPGPSMSCADLSPVRT
jgi:hypothetical protein